MREAARRTQQTTSIYIDPASSDSEQEDASSGKGKGKVPAAGPQKKVGQTFGTGDADSPKKKARVNSNKKGKGVARAQQELEEGNGQLGMLLDMPLDVVAEVCSHLEPKDLLNLSVSIKTFRQLLMSPTSASRGIWKQARENAGLPELKGVSEDKFAKLLDGTKCMDCGKAKARLDLYLRTRFCRACRNEKYVTKNAVSKTLPHVHEQAINCVLSTVQGPAHSDYSAGWRTRPYYIVSDLEKISYKLFELQDEDELAELAQASTRRKSSGGTRSRRSTVVEEEVQPTEVEKFVKMKQAWVEQTQKESKAVGDALARKEARDLAEARRLQQEKRDAEHAALEAHKSELINAGWTLQQWETYQDYQYYFRRASLIPASKLADDPQGWNTFKAKVDERIAVNAVEDQRQLEQKQATARLNARKQGIRHFFSSMRIAQSEDQQVTFPPFNSFLQLKNVKPFWETDDAPKLVEAVWSMKEQEILNDAASYRETKRVETIKLILAATGDANTRLSDDPDDHDEDTYDPDDYDEDTYDEAFFGRITSLFIKCEDTWRYGIRMGNAPSNSIKVRPYPEALAPLASAYAWFGTSSDTELNLKLDKSREQVIVLRTMLKAANLDEATAAVDDLDRVGKKWRWLENPGSRKALATFEWKPLLLEILGRARRARRHPFATPTIVVDGVEVNQSDSEDEDEDEMDDDDDQGEFKTGLARKLKNGVKEEEESEDEAMEASEGEGGAGEGEGRDEEEDSDDDE